MGQPAGAMSKLSRRSLIGGAAVAALAALPPLEALAALPSGVSKHASKESLGELAEARRLVGALIANDDAITAAERADDEGRAKTLEGEHGPLYCEFLDFADRVHRKQPQTWLDIVIRAEIAGYMIAWDRPRTNWEAMREEAENDPSEDYPGMKELAMAVLYLAARSQPEQPDMRAA